MSRFADVLRATGDRLDLPQPARLRVLRELAADLEDLYDAYRARGCDEAEARRRAVESMDLSADALAALGAVHRGPVRRLLDRVSPDALARWERTLLGVLTLLALAVAVSLVDGRTVFADAGPWILAVLPAAAAALLIALAKAYQILLKQDHHPRRLHRGMDGLRILALVLPLLGLLGGWSEAYRLSVDAAAAARPLAALLLAWGLRASALLVISLALGLLTALAWFFLAGRIGRIERDEAAILLDR